MGCNTSANCGATTPICNPNSHQCVASGCSDGIKDGSETDVDCGGGTCSKCANGQSCGGGSDCQSGYCSGNKCYPATCNDGMKDGNETDVDCGGGFGGCPKCPNGKLCQQDHDCISDNCSGGSTCQP